MNEANEIEIECTGCASPLTDPKYDCPLHGSGTKIFEELLAEAKRRQQAAACSDPAKMEAMIRRATELIQADGFVAVALCCSYSCGAHGFHALTGLVAGETTKTENGDLRAMVQRLRDLANQIERDFPLPGELPPRPSFAERVPS